jgi:uncharacterized membrane protein
VTNHNVRPWIEAASVAIESLAVAIIVVFIVYASVVYILRTVGVLHLPGIQAYAQYKEGLGRALQLGLEILVAADVVRTVALEPTLENVAVLGILVVIRTFLSWSLFVELQGFWPWQGKEQARGSPDAGEP